MQHGTPSITAMRVAMRRAAHQIYDRPLVLDDPIALAIMGEERCDKLRSDPATQSEPIAVAMRAFMAVRSRFAEDHLAQAVSAGANQYVVLGAGLDTFAHRNPFLHLRVFEVDFPATQTWKQEMLQQAGLPITPPGLTYAPVDFESDTLAHGLEAAGFDPTQKTFFSWLGVVPYLTLEAFRSTVAFTATLPAGSGLALDYGLPREALSLKGKLAFDYLSARVRRAGEPFQLFFTPEQIAAELTVAGYTTIEDLNPAAITARYFAACPERSRTGGDTLAIRGEMGHLVCAWL
jgi:methyltransferase (TIGR00027 family)